jgi:hypothetical protein
LINEIDRARDALNYLDAGCSREDWVKVGMAAKSSGLLFDDFHSWSATAGNYSSEKECKAVWQSFNESGGIALQHYFIWPIKTVGLIALDALKARTLHYLSLRIR